MDDKVYFENKKDELLDRDYPFYSAVAGGGSKGYYVPMHCHNYIEVLYFTEGFARVFAAGKWYDVNKYDLMIINAREVHSVKTEDGVSFQHVVISFDLEFIQALANGLVELKYLLPFVCSGLGNNRIISGSEIVRSPIPTFIEEIYSEYKDKSYGYELAMKADISKLLLWILRRWHRKGITLPSGKKYNEIHYKNLEKVLLHIQVNFMNSTSIGEAAKMCCMSESYFMSFFKSVMGKTFTNYVNFIRISEAEKLLLTSDVSIANIAMETGMVDSSYFIKQFKRMKGISPHAYRKKFSSVSE